jgi:hypothetical protein
MTVRSFARSNQDLPSRFRRRDNTNNGGNNYYNNVNNNLSQKRSKSAENDPKYSSSGAVEQPILAMGELSYAQTYSGERTRGSSQVSFNYISVGMHWFAFIYHTSHAGCSKGHFSHGSSFRCRSAEQRPQRISLSDARLPFAQTAEWLQTARPHLLQGPLQ